MYQRYFLLLVVIHLLLVAMHFYVLYKKGFRGVLLDESLRYGGECQGVLS